MSACVRVCVCVCVRACERVECVICVMCLQMSTNPYLTLTLNLTLILNLTLTLNPPDTAFSGATIPLDQRWMDDDDDDDEEEEDEMRMIDD